MNKYKKDLNKLNQNIVKSKFSQYLRKRKSAISNPSNNKIENILQSKHSNFKVRNGPSGIHVFNRVTGLNILFDEFQLPPALWSKAPCQVSIALTNMCDFECAHCFVPKGEEMLDFNLLIKWLEELDVNGCLGVGFGGGEPMLYPHLIKLCQYAARKTKLSVTLTTHAHRLNTELIKGLSGFIHFIRVSMDGVGSTYESIRKRSFDAFQHRIKMALDIAPVGINYLVNSQTISDLNKAIAFAEDLSISELLLLPQQPASGNGGINNKTAQILRYWVNNYHGKLLLTVSEIGSEGLPTCNPVANENGLCSYSHIDANGILKRTSFDSKGIAIGNGSIISAIEKLRNKLEGGKL